MKYNGVGPSRAALPLCFQGSDNFSLIVFFLVCFVFFNNWYLPLISQPG